MSQHAPAPQLLTIPYISRFNFGATHEDIPSDARVVQTHVAVSKIHHVKSFLGISEREHQKMSWNKIMDSNVAIESIDCKNTIILIQAL